MKIDFKPLVIIFDAYRSAEETLSGIQTISERYKNTEIFTVIENENVAIDEPLTSGCGYVFSKPINYLAFMVRMCHMLS